MSNPNPQQLKAITSTSHTTIVLASPGSGKTFVMVERIRNLVALGADPQQIVCITFTTNGAAELAKRLRPHGIDLGFCGTIHGYCLRLLNRHGDMIGYRKGRAITLISPEGHEQLVKDVRDRLGYAKMSMVSISNPNNIRGAAIMAEVASVMKRNNMISYDHILRQGAKLLPMLVQKLLLNVTHLLVDEIQDSGNDDWAVFAEIPGDRTYVGDPDQSIFAFRGARPEIITASASNFAQKHIEALNVVTLETCYRCAPAICLAATNLIAYNPDRIPKSVMPRENWTTTGIVEVVGFDNGRQEAVKIAERLKFGAQDTTYGEMAVLCRTNALADELRNVIREFGIPVASDGERRMPSDWKMCLTALQVIINPANDILVEQLWKMQHRDQLKVNRAKMDAMKAGRPLVEQDYELANILSTISVSETIALMQISAESIAIVTDRYDMIAIEGGGLPELLADLWTMERPAETERNAVHVGTIHSAKGREWDLVVVAGCEEGVLPTAKAEDLEEMRRLMFVAITRVRHYLVLTHAATRFEYGRQVNRPPSRFLQEIQ